MVLYSASVQFSSVTQLCLTLCDPMNHSTPGLPVHHQLLEFTQTHTHRVGDAIQPSHPVVPFCFCPQSLPASGSFPMSQFFARGGQSTAVSALASVLPKKSQGWSPSEWTGWISLQFNSYGIRAYHMDTECTHGRWRWAGGCAEMMFLLPSLGHILWWNWRKYFLSRSYF